MMVIDVNPDAYLTPTSPAYSKVLGLQYKRDNSAIHVNVRLDIGEAYHMAQVVSPHNQATRTARYGTDSSRGIAITTNPIFIDENLNTANQAFQGGLLASLSRYVSRGLVRVRDKDTGVVRTAQQIMNYATNGAWA